MANAASRLLDNDRPHSEWRGWLAGAAKPLLASPPTAVGTAVTVFPRTSRKHCASRWPMRSPAATTQGPGTSRAANDPIIERGGGVCVLCHSPGTEINHIDGPSSDPANRRLPCHHCHLGVTLSHCHHGLGKTDAEIDALFDQLTARIDSSNSIRTCNASGWHLSWRAWTRQHSEP